ncbi:MAG TPA: TetR family transcriptional regulator [Streptosporangiaceae bacterium]|jgi:AcrR family transcriptional regulator
MATSSRRRSGRPPGRRPGPTETREAILTAARELFAEKGYDRASIRAIARAADVDPALVHHFYGTKEELFIAAVRFPVNPAEVLPYVLGGPREEMGTRMATTFLHEWGKVDAREPLVGLLRSAMTTEQAAELLRQFVSAAIIARVAEQLDIPLLRMETAAAQMIGVAFLRYVLKVEPIASASDAELVELLAPTLQRYFDGADA